MQSCVLVVVHDSILCMMIPEFIVMSLLMYRCFLFDANDSHT